MLHLEDLGVDGRIILKCIFKTWDAEAWTGLLWNRWWAFVDAVMNLRVQSTAEISGLAEEMLASQARLCFMELIRRDCSPQALVPLTCTPVDCLAEYSGGIQPPSDHTAD